MIIDLLLINAIVSMIFLSGFVDSIDEAIYKRFKPYHLPRPFSCALCMTTWCCIIWLLINGNLTLFTLMLSLLSATLTSVTMPLITTIENILLKIIELINRLLDVI